MPGIAEGLPTALQVLTARAGSLPGPGVSPEVRSRVLEWSQRPELPSLPALAEVLERFRSGFGELEWRCEPEHLRGTRDPPPRTAAPSLVVARLDVGLRSLRAARRLTQAQVCDASGVRQARLSSWERPEAGEKPSIPELDSLLRALSASYIDLEGAIQDPFRPFRSLERQLERSAPLVLDGQVAPAIVTERFDLGLRALRAARGWSRRELAEASGVKVGRIQGFETRGVTKPPSWDEAAALLHALTATRAELEEAARNPLKELEGIERQWRNAQRELGRRQPLRFGKETAPTVVSERFDLALQVLRSRKGWSRKILGDQAGLEPARVTALETWGNPAPATEEEIQALRRALDAELHDFEGAARWPLRALTDIRRRLRALERDLLRTEDRLEAAREELGASARPEEVPPGPVEEAARAAALSVTRLRRSLLGQGSRLRGPAGGRGRRQGRAQDLES